APTPQVTGEAEKEYGGRPNDPRLAQPAVSLTFNFQPSTFNLHPSSFDRERLWSVYDDWEPAAAADPTAPNVYQMTTRYDGPPPCSNCGLPAIVFRRSSDGGRTWQPDQFILQTRRTQNDPQIEVATDGAIYAAILNEYRPGVLFLKSTDYGQSWSDPIPVTPSGPPPNWSDRPILAISPDGRDVYLAFNASDSYVIASHDYGQSFGQPVQTNQDRRYWFHSQAAVAPNGDVYVAAADYSQNYTGDVHINVLKSNDGGLTWATTRLDTSGEAPPCEWAPGCYLGFLGPVVGVAVDPAGTILVAYNAGLTDGAPQRLFVRVSTDGGLTWSPRRELSNGDPDVNNGFPAVSAGPTPGDFRVVWQDDRHGPTESFNTWLRQTLDGGRTWRAAVRLSDRPSGPPYKHPAGYQFPYGDYLELAVDGNGVNHVLWGAGESYTGPGGTWYTRGGH
ncbi:MAG: sialidase family protein, partial [Chloroflexota bacterium]